MKNGSNLWWQERRLVVHDLMGSVANIRSSIENLRDDPKTVEILLQKTLTKLLERLRSIQTEKRNNK